MRYSVLDLSPVPEGGTPADAFANTLALAQHVEKLGYHRYWLAEHHNMEGIASAATSILIGQVASATKTIRVGSGGIMLPNHSPLTIAEQFGTLATLFPGRIDLAALPAAIKPSRVPCAATWTGPMPFQVTSPNSSPISATQIHQPPSKPCRVQAPMSRSGCSAHRSLARSSPPISACHMPLPPISHPAR